MKDSEKNFSGLMDDAGAFRQQVRMAAVQVAGLGPEELSQALAYELEPFSGIPAAEAEVVYREIADADPAVRVYDVAVKRRRRRGRGACSIDRMILPVAILACIVILGVAVDWLLFARRISALADSVSERRPLQAQIDRLNADTRKAESEAAGIRSHRESVVRAQDRAADLRRRHADFLEVLASACGDRAVVTSIASGGRRQGMRVRAIGTSVDAAAETMRLMTCDAAKFGWRIVPGAISSSGTGTTVSFGFEGLR